MDDSDFQHLLATVSEWGAEVAPPLRGLHQEVLRHFAASTRPPDFEELQAWAGKLGIDNLREALGDLAAVDLIEVEAGGERIVGAYPFATTPHDHRVELDGGPSIEAYCAIDALGVSLLLRRGATVHSVDPQNGDVLRIRVDGEGASSEPPAVVVTLPATGRGYDSPKSAPAHESVCPTCGFYTSAASVERYARAHRLSLQVLSLAQAHQLAAAAFGGLLEADIGRLESPAAVPTPCGQTGPSDAAQGLL